MSWHPNSEGRYGAKGAKGDLGELIVKEYCECSGLIYESKNDYYSQVHLKIDCLIDNIPVDVKANFFSGFLCVELYDKKKNKPGWLYSTTAEQIYGVDVESKSIFRYNVKDMKQYVTKNNTRAKKTKFGDVVIWVPVTSKIIETLQ